MNSELKVSVIAAVLLLCLALGINACKSHMEAKTYTKLTGKEVSTWDALWVKLRVEGCD